MTLGQLVRAMRAIAGVLLLLVAAYAGWLTTLLFDTGHFRTEGSPAGAAIFVVLLMAPLVALVALVFAILLLRPSKAQVAARMQAGSIPKSPEKASRRGERWHRHANGARLGALFNDGRAVLLWIAADASSAQRTEGGVRNPRALTHPFVCRNGMLVQLPFLWTVPDTLAERGIARFEASGDCSEALGWRPLAVPESADSQAWPSALADGLG
jgi:hypothetical protein